MNMALGRQATPRQPVPYLLGFLVVVSALALINVRYHERRAYALLDQAERQVQRLRADAETLKVQRARLTAPARVDRLARERLGMVPIRPAETLYLQAKEQP